MESCIFEGQVRHARAAPVEHRFTYRLFFMYLDLAELPGLFDRRWFWSARRRALARFRRADHFGPADEPLDQSVRKLVQAQTGLLPTGPIRLLTHLSYFGYCFNPVSFYYCFDESGRRVETIVAEVNNTPWGERSCYVLGAGDNVGSDKAKRFRPAKTMHVSPFMDMDVDYDWSFSEPGDTLRVFMANSKGGNRIFDAAIAVERTEINGRSLARVLAQYPFMTARVVIGIYWQALLLWIKRCPIYPHPSKRQALSAKQQTSRST